MCEIGERGIREVNGVETVTIILKYKIMRVLGNASVEELTAALSGTGKKYKLVGHGSPEGGLLAGASGRLLGRLPDGATVWAVHTYGDVTHGTASTGEPYAPPGVDMKLADLVADKSENATFCSVVKGLKVSDLVGRSVVVRNGHGDGVASVIVLSGGEDVKSLCACDGTTIWKAGGTCGTVGM